MSINSVKEHGTAAGGHFLPWFFRVVSSRWAPASLRDLDLIRLHQLCPRLMVTSVTTVTTVTTQHVLPQWRSWVTDEPKLNVLINWLLCNWIQLIGKSDFAKFILHPKVSTWLLAKPRSPMPICSACWSRSCSWGLASQDIAKATPLRTLLTFLLPFRFFRCWSAQAPHGQSHDGLKEKLVERE